MTKKPNRAGRMFPLYLNEIEHKLLEAVAANLRMNKSDVMRKALIMIAERNT